MTIKPLHGVVCPDCGAQMLYCNVKEMTVIEELIEQRENKVRQEMASRIFTDAIHAIDQGRQVQALEALTDMLAEYLK